MRIRVYGNYDKDFAKKYLLRVLYKKWLGEYSNGKYFNMDNYLKTLSRKLKTINILKFALNNSSIVQLDNGVEIEFDESLNYGGFPLKQLLQLIEYGNLEVKGTFTISRGSNNIRYYSDYYFRDYMGDV